jgi:hypothetical protein
VQCAPIIGAKGRPGNSRRGKNAVTLHQEIVMFKNVAAALIAVTMFTGPVLAQNALPVSPAPATQPIKANSAVTHVNFKKHTMKKATVVRHRTHIKHVRHAKPPKFAHTARVGSKPALVKSRTN